MEVEVRPLHVMVMVRSLYLQRMSHWLNEYSGNWWHGAVIVQVVTNLSSL
jgi:hypothetical protein